ncbi:hypothetical protein ACHAW5_008395 [Stephanodiscus triporus]|uniref:Methionine--tRNA ligase n=1 Tax=Stephanodiscus triporus TaxID=2934178 RepID=A0ABD3N3Y7_9STRA
MRINGMIPALLAAAASPVAVRAFAGSCLPRLLLDGSAAINASTATTTSSSSSVPVVVVVAPIFLLLVVVLVVVSASEATGVGVGTPSTTEFPPSRSDPHLLVSDRPRIGHAYTSLACDVIARYMRHSGGGLLPERDRRARAEGRGDREGAGMEPSDFCDMISMAVPGPPDDDHHKDAVRSLWRTLTDAGAVYLGSYEGWYSVRDECYYNESELVDGRAPTGAEVAWVKKEDSYFFRLSEYADRLLEHYEKYPISSRRNPAGTRSCPSISRTTFDWGVKVPDDEGHVMYVWIDALRELHQRPGIPRGGPVRGRDSIDSGRASLHVVGKDILRFHADGEKISKSLGNVIDPVELVDRYGVTFGSSGDFSDERMVHKRIMTLVYKNCDGATPSEVGEYTDDDEAILATARSLRHRTGGAISTQSIDRYVQHMISMVWDANRYIDAQAPWTLKKTDVGRMRTVLYVLMEVMRHVAILYQPLMPASSNAILDQLGVPSDERDFVHLSRGGCEIKLGREVIKPTAVFPRFEVPVGAAV